MEGIGGFLIFIVIAIISAVSKQNKKNQQQGTNNNQGTKTTGNSSTMVQDSIRDLVGQIEKKINDAANTSSANTANRSQTPPRPNNTQQARLNSTQQPRPYNPSLEGTKMEGYQMEGHQMEGHKVEGHKVEGHKVEGLKREHRHGFKSSMKPAHTELSMGRKYAGEGCKSHYDKDIVDSKAIKVKKKDANSLVFSDNPVVQGLVMSQILERPKRRY